MGSPRTCSYPELLRVTGPLLSLVLQTEDVWQRYNQIHQSISGLSIRVYPSHPYIAGRAGLGSYNAHPWGLGMSRGDGGC
jgi:hypothetical protein